MDITSLCQNVMSGEEGGREHLDGSRMEASIKSCWLDGGSGSGGDGGITVKWEKALNA